MSENTLDKTVPLRFNGAPLTCAAGTSLGGLLTRQDIPADAVATAVNGEFVPRAMRDALTLKAGDDVLTFQAIVGG